MHEGIIATQIILEYDPLKKEWFTYIQDETGKYGTFTTGFHCGVEFLLRQCKYEQKS